MALPDDMVHRAPAELLQFAAHDRQASARDSVRCTWRLTSQPEPTNHNKISQSSGLPQQGKTLVHVACSVGDLALVRQLHEAGANLNAIDKNGHQPIHTASLRGHTELLSFLLTHGADPHARDQVYLHQLATCCSVPFAHSFADDCSGQSGFSALHFASGEGHADAVAVLLEAGADAEARSRDGFTPLYLAAWKGHEACVRQLAARTSVSAMSALDDKHGLSALHRACSGGHTRVIQCLVQHKADINARSADGLSGWQHYEASRARVAATDHATLLGTLELLGVRIEAAPPPPSVRAARRHLHDETRVSRFVVVGLALVGVAAVCAVLWSRAGAADE